jgi:Flp pilus assembly protein TadD/4-amino-4-deoxy-L-arabinose transferase-like glycosyltransferase
MSKKKKTKVDSPFPGQSLAQQQAPIVQSLKQDLPFRRWEFVVLGALVLIGLVLRLIYLGEIEKRPDFRFPPVDAGFHNYWARALVSGQWSALPEEAAGRDPEIQKHPFFRPPGYPYFLALIYWLTGSSHIAARAVQMGIGLLTSVLAFLLGRKLFGRAPGLIFSGFMNLYWLFIYFEGQLQEPVLLNLLLLALAYVVVLITERVTFTRGLIAGVLIGLFALTRPNILLLAPVMLVWGWWILRRRKALSRFLLFAVSLAMGVGLAVFPATIRNYLASRELVLISSNAGVNLYIGNNEHANGRFIDDIPDLGHFRGCFDYSTIVQNLESKFGHKLRYTDVSKFYAQKAGDFVRANPSKFLGLLFQKTLLFWGPGEITHNNAVRFDREFSRVLKRIPGNYASTVALGFVGALMLFLILRSKESERRFPNKEATLEFAVWSVLFLLTYFVSFLPFFVTSLYRMPVIPVLLLFGSYGLWSMVDSFRERRHVFGAGWLAVLIMLTLLLNLPELLASPDKYKPDLARWWFAQGVCHSLDKKPDKAAEAYRNAIAVDPNNSRSENNLAGVYYSLGRVDEAMQHYSRAVEINPYFEEAYCGLALILNNRGKYDEAVKCYKKAVDLNPYLVEARFGLANVMAMLGRFDEAIEQYSIVLQQRPGYVSAYSNKGVVLATKGKYDEAVQLYNKALQLSPNDPKVYANIGIALESKGDFAGAIQNYRHALELNSADTPTQQRLAGVLKKQNH